MVTMPDKRFRVFATCDIGDALDLLRQRGYEVEVYPSPEPPPKSLIIDKTRSGIDGLITTLRDPIDAEVFEAGKGHLKVVAQIAIGFDNINRNDANRYKIPFTHTADVLTEATAEFAFFMIGALARKLRLPLHPIRAHPAQPYRSARFVQQLYPFCMKRAVLAYRPSVFLRIDKSHCKLPQSALFFVLKLL
jgi:phosphoglycerate dehydrogenase-like enzyme